MKHVSVRGLKPGLILAGLACALALGAAGCATMKKRPERPLFGLSSATEKDVALSAREVGKEELVAKYTTVDNPFIAPPSLGGSNQIVVFELTVSSPQEVRILLKDIEFHFGSYFSRPLSGFQLEQYWEPRIQKQDTYRGWTSARVAQLINRTVVPPRLTVKPNEPYRGYVVFMGRFPSSGDASLHVPVYTRDGALLHRFEL